MNLFLGTSYLNGTPNEVCPFGPEHEDDWAIAANHAMAYYKEYEHAHASWECKAALPEDQNFMDMCALRSYEAIQKLGYLGSFNSAHVTKWLEQAGCLDEICYGTTHR
ncbi:uncharacterized protein RHO25_012542 [Cercospora beticola]|uniref:Uncharacterized protein n=1 Tax=Cercospora beticola TaxID=122368 RepID=A0ABZ0P7T7_CERBT|nr:hypothetical protein RHO25_012542 [Cercospora beticola]